MKLKARLGKRMHSLKGVNSNMIVIDIEGSSDINRRINLYRSFSPQDNVSARDKFKYQLQLMKNTRTEKCVVLGDFNMD